MEDLWERYTFPQVAVYSVICTEIGNCLYVYMGCKVTVHRDTVLYKPIGSSIWNLNDLSDMGINLLWMDKIKWETKHDLRFHLKE